MFVEMWIPKMARMLLIAGKLKPYDEGDGLKAIVDDAEFQKI
jgi:hypothetical protein